MAYTTTDKYKKLIYSEDSEQVIRVIINGKEINSDYIKNISVDDDVFESDGFYLGSATICKYELELDNEILESIGNFDEVTLEFDLIISDTEKETIPLGTYIVQKNDNKSDNYTNFILYDYMKKFDEEIDFSEIIPCTRFELLQYICNYFGLVLKNTSIINGDVIVGVYDNTIKAKTWLVFISERAGGFAKITRNKELIIKSFNEVDICELPTDMIGEFKTDELRTITKVVYENATQKFEAGTDDGEILYLSSESPFSCTQEEVDNIFNVVNGLQFQSLDLRIWGDPAIDTGDIIKVNDMISFAQKKWSFANGFYGNYKTTLNKTNKMSNVERIPPAKKIKRLQSQLDEESGKIRLLTETTEVIENNLTNNYYTISQTNEMIQNSSDGVTNTFSEAGGNNVLRNTGLWFEDSSKKEYLYPSHTLFPSPTTFLKADSHFEYWDGYAKKGKNDQASLYSSIILQKGFFKQEQEVPNGNYTISFYYKKLNPLANVTVTINDNVYSLDDTDTTQFVTGKQDENGNYITAPLNVTSGHIAITFYTDINDSVEIYDLMANRGTVKLAYSQNENEVTTDTVNISKGITITSSVTDTKFKANSDGIRVLNKNSEKVITDFTDKGMTIKEAIIEDEATIVKTLIQDIDNQTWFTRL